MSVVERESQKKKFSFISKQRSLVHGGVKLPRCCCFLAPKLDPINSFTALYRSCIVQFEAKIFVRFEAFIANENYTLNWIANRLTSCNIDSCKINPIGIRVQRWYCYKLQSYSRYINSNLKKRLLGPITLKKAGLIPTETLKVNSLRLAIHKTWEIQNASWRGRWGNNFNLTSFIKLETFMVQWPHLEHKNETGKVSIATSSKAHWQKFVHQNCFK